MPNVFEVVGKVIGIQIDLEQNQGYLICRIPLYPLEREFYLVGKQNSEEEKIYVQQIQMNENIGFFRISTIRRNSYLDLYIKIPNGLISSFTKQEKISLIVQQQQQQQQEENPRYFLIRIIKYFPRQV